MADSKADGKADGKAESEPTPTSKTSDDTIHTSRGFGAPVCQHFKKLWWLYLVIFIAIVLVVVLPIIYVAYPRTAQKDINDSSLNITRLTILDPAPNSFQLDLTQVIGNPSSYHPTIYAFNASASLASSTVPFAYVAIPQIASEDGAVVVVSERVQLDNESAFEDYVSAAILRDEVALNIYGEPQLKDGSLPRTTVTYNKTVLMKGLNSLEGFNITDFNILTSPEADGTNVNGTIYIPNPTAITIQMGNLTFDLSVAGTRIGQSHIRDFTLVPGNNTLPMTSAVNLTLVVGLLTQKNTPYTDGILPITITGNSSVYKGQELPYFTSALAAANISVELNTARALSGLGL